MNNLFILGDRKQSIESGKQPSEESIYENGLWWSRSKWLQIIAKRISQKLICWMSSEGLILIRLWLFLSNYTN